MIFVESNSILLMKNCHFENILTDGPGTIIYINKLYNDSAIISNNIINNSISKTSFISIAACLNVSFENNSFVNNQGNMISVSNSVILAINNKFTNNSCLYGSGCVFTINLISFVYLSNNKYMNINNTYPGATIYLEESFIDILNDTLINGYSEMYSGCLMGINSEINMRSFYGYNFTNGCLYFVNSTISLNDSIFQTNYIQSPQNYLCMSILCSINDREIKINNVVFQGNRNNTFDGGVIYFS